MMNDRVERTGEGHADDATLAEAARRGSMEALEQLYRRYRDLVYGAAYRVTGTGQDAEDVVQDVFVGLPRAIDRYEERGRFHAWIRGVATRVALMKVRHRARRSWEPLPSDRASSQPAPDLAVDRIALREALDAMPASQRTVFLLKEVDGYSHHEIAEMLGVGASACRVRLHRAWRFLERWRDA